MQPSDSRRARSRGPNILLILTDQQRRDSLGCYGADPKPLAAGTSERLRADTICLYRNTGINRTTRDRDPPLDVSTIIDGRYKLSLHGSHEARPAVVPPEQYVVNTIDRSRR